jgi:hypothetical protein
MAPVHIGIERRPLPKGAHQEASAGLGGCEAAGGRLSWLGPKPALRTETVVSLRWHSASVACSRAGRKTERMASSTLQVLPLLLEGLDKAGVGGWGVPSGHLRERLDAPDPLGNLGPEPLREGRLGAEEAAEVSSTVDKLEAKALSRSSAPG